MTRMDASETCRRGALAGMGTGVLGAWLPSVYKRPVRHTPDGEPVVTDEPLRGAQFGLHGTDLLVVLAAVVAAVVVARTERGVTDAVVVAASLLVLAVGLHEALQYVSVDRYGVDFGTYLLTVGGAVSLVASSVPVLERIRRRDDRPRATRSTAGGDSGSVGRSE